jgi:hypothetical protein
MHSFLSELYTFTPCNSSSSEYANAAERCGALKSDQTALLRHILKILGVSWITKIENRMEKHMQNCPLSIRIPILLILFLLFFPSLMSKDVPTYLWTSWRVLKRPDLQFEMFVYERTIRLFIDQSLTCLNHFLDSPLVSDRGVKKDQMMGTIMTNCEAS